MTMDQKVKYEIKSKMTLAERVAMYVPGYRGYRERNLRRDEDRAVRNELSRAIQGTKQELATVQRTLVRQPGPMMDVERIRTKVDRYDIDVKKAANGYSGFHASMKVQQEDLDRLVEWDAGLFDDIELLRQHTSELMAATDSDGEVQTCIRQLERTIDSLIESYNQRESIMKGLTDGGEE
ncbi:MAG: hypothetical protein J6K69_03920 [Candidatus Methanomethylophilaceae archaeon]|nr:hypothetical protein [Candidatus Methanomethylophilaceae archaeon]